MDRIVLDMREIGVANAKAVDECLGELSTEKAENRQFMATSFVGMRDHGFWAPDSLLEIWLTMVAKELEDGSYSEALKTYAQHLKLTGSGKFPGCMDPNLNSLTNVERDELISAIQRIVAVVSKEPDRLSKNALMALGENFQSYQRDIEYQFFMALGKVLVDLLSGAWAGRAEDEESLPRSWMR